MNLNKFIYFGTFKIEEAYLIDIRTGYQGDLFLSIAKESNQENEEYIGVVLQNNEPRIDLVSIQRNSYLFNISGEIYKNPNTHKIIYVVKDTNSIEFIKE